MQVTMREASERREHEVLSPDATFSDASRGRERKETPDVFRTCFTLR